MAELKSTSLSSSLTIAITGLMTALTTITSVAISLYIPASNGFFNLGEAMVYIAAILFGPVVGGFAGGVGSFLADVFLGFGHFAPGTLVIKGIEGVVVGVLYMHLRKLQHLRYRWLTYLFAGIIAVILAGIGLLYYVGIAEFTGFSILFPGSVSPGADLIIYIPGEIWIVLAILAASMIILLGHYSDAITNIKIISMIVGGSCMVTGYLLYEIFILAVGGFIEVPFNALQVIIGLVIALPVTRTLEQSLTQLFPRPLGSI